MARDGDAGGVAEMFGGGLQRKILNRRPEVQLVSLGAAVEAAEGLFAQVDRETRARSRSAPG